MKFPFVLYFKFFIYFKTFRYCTRRCEYAFIENQSMKIATLPDFLIAVLLLLWWPGAGGFSDSLTLSLDEAVDYALDTFNQERNPSKARYDDS